VPNDEGPKAFFISPIGEAGSDTRTKADQTLKHLVRKALQPEPLNCKVDRADEDTDPGSITPRMLNAIMIADLVVIDLTDHNPNVFYEMAIAHGYRRPCVHVITEGQKIPFDVRIIRESPTWTSAYRKVNSYVKCPSANSCARNNAEFGSKGGATRRRPLALAAAPLAA